MNNTEIVKHEDVLFLFDVDGTLSYSRSLISEKMLKMLKELKKHVNIAFVGGSDLCKQKEQIGDDLLSIFDYGFPENGVQYYKKDVLIKSESILHFLGEANYENVSNFILKLLSETKLPKKRGVFVELRGSMINVSPIGRSCSVEERLEFYNYDNIHEIRKNMCEILNEEFEKYGLMCSIGGQISIDIFPKGWDKTYALQHIKEKQIYFFGDMTDIGGNDYEIYTHHRVHGVKVRNPNDTFEKVNKTLKELGIGIINL